VYYFVSYSEDLLGFNGFYPNPFGITPQESFWLPVISENISKNPLFEVISLHGPTGPL
jgi:hypothetical protein